MIMLIIPGLKNVIWKSVTTIMRMEVSGRGIWVMYRQDV